MHTFISFTVKETRHILRDPRTLLMLFGMPVVMILLFGFAISNDVRNVRTVVVMSSADGATHKAVERLGASEYFTITHTVATPADAERLVRSRKADMAIVFCPRFADRAVTGHASAQLILDAADPNMAVQQANYAKQVLASGLGAAPVTTKMLYNPQMRSTYNFVPGIMGMLLLLVCALMTSVSIVREKERGTMDVLLVSPVRPITIIASKMFPYMVLSLCILVCILLLSAFVLDVPIRGSLASIMMVSLVYILLSLALGLLISIASKTQLAALLASAMVLMMPTLLLSGLIYPIESMPDVLQWISAVVPARWYISAIRKLMVMGVSLDTIATEVGVLCAMAATLMAASLLLFAKSNR